MLSITGGKRSGYCYEYDPSAYMQAMSLILYINPIHSLNHKFTMFILLFFVNECTLYNVHTIENSFNE